MGDPANPGIPDITVPEGDDAIFGVSIQGAAAGSTVTLALADGTAIDADYNEARFEFSTDGGTTWTAVSGPIAVPAGTSSLLVRTDTVADGVDEPDETFTLTGTLSSGSSTVADTGTATIVDGDDEPTLEVPAPGREDTRVLEASLGPRAGEPAGTAEMADGNPNNNSSKAETTSGTIFYTQGDAPATVSINGTVVGINGIAVPGSQTVNGTHGTLTITSVTATSIGYSYTLTDNTFGNGAHDDFSVLVTDADDDQASGILSITIVDDRPHATDFNGIIENVAGENLVGLIDYGLGADGFGGVNLTFGSATSQGAPIVLKSNGSTVDVASMDLNGDGLQEVVGFIDSGTAGYDAGDHLVFTLAPTLSGEAYGEYALTLHDVLDLQAETQNFTVGAIQAGAPTTGIVVSDGNGGDIAVLATPEAGNQVNSNTGELGINNTILNSGEKITLAFGTAFSGTAVTTKAVLNDVRITGVDVGSGTDSFNWVALKDGAQVGSGNNFVMSTVSGQNLIAPAIHVDGGYDTLVLTTVSGAFKMSGFSFSQLGDSFDTLLNFSYTATDGDGDAVAGSFQVTVTDDTSAVTALSGAGQLATITSTGQDYMAP